VYNVTYAAQDVGYHAADALGPCWTFPERDGAGRVIGILRRYCGPLPFESKTNKFAMPFGKRGLFIPQGWRQRLGAIWLCEGPSDALALTALHLAAIGRPSNTGGGRFLAELLRDLPADRLLIVLGEYDAKPDGSWPGRDGAARLAAGLEASLGRPVFWVLPPATAKDVRAWVCGHRLNPLLGPLWIDLGKTFVAQLEGQLQRPKRADADNATTGREGQPKADSTAGPANPPDPPPEPWEPPLPFGEFAVPPFPSRVLPEWLAVFVAAEAQATQTPLDLAGLLTLAVCAAGLAKKFRVRARPGWTEPTNLYALIALPPGNRKSAVFADVVDPVKQLEQEELARRKPEVAEAASHYRTLEARLKAAEGRTARVRDLGERAAAQEEARRLARELSGLTLPAPPRFLVDDITAESLPRHLLEQGGRLLGAAAEGTLLDNIHRYSESPNFDNLLKAHAGDDLRVDRVGRPSEFVDQPALTLALTIQPDVVSGLATRASLRGRGLLARFLYALPASLVGRRRIAAPPVPAAVAQRYRECLMELWRLTGTVGSNGQPAPHLLELDPMAERTLRDFEAALEPRLAEGGDLEFLADWASKLAGAAVRLAGILHMADCIGEGRSWQGPVGVAAMGRAVALAGDYLIPHARAAFGLMGADEEVEAARRVLAWVGREGRTDFKRWQLYNDVRNQGRFPRVEDLDRPLDRLVKHRYLRVRPCPPGKGRPPEATYEVNPLADHQENQKNQKKSVDHPEADFF
jgi:hypothetical protein